MNNKKKPFLKIGALALGLIVLSSCTASFCSPTDIGHMLYKQDNGLVVVDNNGVYELTYGPVLNQIIVSAASEGITVPTLEYYEKLDEKVANFATTLYTAKYTDNTLVGEALKEAALTKFGYVKYLGNKNTPTTQATGSDLWVNWTLWTHEISLEIGAEKVPNADFKKFYKDSIYKKISANRACIALYDGEYGAEGSQHTVEGKSWKYAFDRGLIEGLLVYPVAALVETLTRAFGAGGWGQIFAILLATLIIRGIMILATLKQTIGAQKMQALQPEIAKLQQKFPNSSNNQYEKQQLAAAQMALYKKHKINPLGSMFIMLLQFPVFIAVWGALTGSAILSSDAVWGLNLNAQLGGSITSNFFTPGWWTAVGLFLIMTASQFVSTKLSTWLNASKAKESVEKLTVNPAADKQASQSKMMMNIMFIMIIVMSFTLPAAMGVYWLAGAIISIAQTLIVHKTMKGKK